MAEAASPVLAFADFSAPPAAGGLDLVIGKEADQDIARGKAPDVSPKGHTATDFRHAG
jgi:hypothetical protein